MFNTPGGSPISLDIEASSKHVTDVSFEGFSLAQLAYNSEKSVQICSQGK
jgi:hypothetical protein